MPLSAPGGAAGGAPAGPSPVRLRMDVDLNVPANTSVLIPFPTEDFDASGLHEAVTNPSRITATVAGKYLIVANILPNAPSVQVQIWKTLAAGGNSVPAQSGYSARSIGEHVLAVAVVDLAVGDYISLKAFNADATLARTIFSGTSSILQATYLGA